MKKNKENIKRSKAFTLIELLATIAILGVISTVVIVSVINVKKKTDDTASKVSVVNIKTMAKTYATEYSLDWGKYSDTDTNTYTCVSIQELINFGYFKQKSFEGKSQEELYKYYILTKNNNTKVITSVEEVTDDTTIKNCDIVAKNLLQAPEVNTPTTTTDSTTITFFGSRRVRNGKIVFDRENTEEIHADYYCNLYSEDGNEITINIDDESEKKCYFDGLKQNKKYTYEVCAQSTKDTETVCSTGSLETKDIKIPKITFADAETCKEEKKVTLTYDNTGITEGEHINAFVFNTTITDTITLTDSINACDNIETLKEKPDECTTNIIEQGTTYYTKKSEIILDSINVAGTFELKTYDGNSTDGTNSSVLNNQKIVKVGDSSPTVPIIIADSAWTKSNRTVSVSTPSTNKSGCGITYEYYDSKTEITNPNNFSGTWTKCTNNQAVISTEGIHYIYFRAVSSDKKSDVSKYQIVKIDKYNPIITINPNTYTTYKKNTSVSLTLSDSGSGIAPNQTIYYAWTTSSTAIPSYTQSVSTSSNTVSIPTSSMTSLNGTYYLHIKAGTVKDIAGNTNSQQVNSSVFRFDNTAPSISSVGVTNYLYNRTLTVNASDSLSGIKYYYYSKDNGSSYTSSTSSSYSFNSLAIGTHYMKVKVEDKAGNTTNPTSKTVVVEPAPPTPNINASDYISSGNWHTSSFRLNFSVSSYSYPVTYYYGTSYSSLYSTGNSIYISSNTSSTTYYVKACLTNNLSLCSGVNSYTVKKGRIDSMQFYVEPDSQYASDLYYSYNVRNIYEIYSYSVDTGYFVSAPTKYGSYYINYAVSGGRDYYYYDTETEVYSANTYDAYEECDEYECNDGGYLYRGRCTGDDYYDERSKGCACYYDEDNERYVSEETYAEDCYYAKKLSCEDGYSEGNYYVEDYFGYTRRVDAMCYQWYHGGYLDPGINYYPVYLYCEWEGDYEADCSDYYYECDRGDNLYWDTCYYCRDGDLSGRYCYVEEEVIIYYYRYLITIWYYTI